MSNKLQVTSLLLAEGLDLELRPHTPSVDHSGRADKGGPDTPQATPQPCAHTLKLMGQWIR